MAPHRDEAAPKKPTSTIKTTHTKKKKHHETATGGGRGDRRDPTTGHTLVVKVRASDSVHHADLTHAASSRVVVPTTVGEGHTVADGYATGVYRILLESRRAERLCESVMLRYRHVAHLRKLFEAEDTLRTGTITPDEFFAIINEDKRTLTLGIFAFVGLAPPVSRLTFDDFVICVVTFAALSRPELLHYAFTLFDHDASGAMDERELVAFCGDLKNKGFFFARNVQVAQHKLVGANKRNRALNDGLVDYQDIASGTTQFPAAFYPILQFQRNIRIAVLGERFWDAVTERSQRIEALVHYMRLNKGHLPPLALVDHVKAFFSRSVFGLRKAAVVKYAGEKRAWELERVQAAATNAPSTAVHSVEDGGH